MSELVLRDNPAPHVRLLTLNRPDRLNAMTAELCEALHEELRQAAADRSCRAVVLTGAGRAFCAGLDLRGYGNAPGNDRRSSGWKFVKDADVEVAVQGERQGAWNWRGRHD